MGVLDLPTRYHQTQVLSAIPTAIGALCLNEPGLNHFVDTRLAIFDKFFSVFLSEKHARTLNDRENAVVIGANFDELVRHHPSLKQPVFEAITTLLNALYEKGKEYTPENVEGYGLVQVATVEASASSAAARVEAAAEVDEVVADVAMTDIGATATPQALGSKDGESKREDNQVLTYIAITGRVRTDCFNNISDEVHLHYLI